MSIIRVTEYLNMDLEKETWLCNRCGVALGTARDSYMKGCLVSEKPGVEIYGVPYSLPNDQVVSYSPDPNFMKVLEFYCPSCGVLMEVQYLPPGHPIPNDIELDIDKLKHKYLG